MDEDPCPVAPSSPLESLASFGLSKKEVSSASAALDARLSPEIAVQDTKSMDGLTLMLLHSRQTCEIVKSALGLNIACQLWSRTKFQDGH